MDELKISWNLDEGLTQTVRVSYSIGSMNLDLYWK